MVDIPISDSVGYDSIDVDSHLSPEFKSILDACSLSQKKWMYIALRESIKSEITRHRPSQFSINWTEFVEKVDNFIPSDFLEEALMAEVSDLGLLKKSDKPLTQWLNSDLRPYYFSDKIHLKHDAKDLSKYPSICKLMELVNQDPRTTQDANSALIIVYNNHKSAIDFHDDNEALIDSNSSISTVTFGSSRNVEFCDHSLRPRTPQHSLSCGNHDMMIMKPGCQERLVHRVRRGDNIAGQGEWRIAVSFRKLSPESTNNNDPEISFDNTPKTHTTDPILLNKITVIAGDSFVVDLDTDRLGKRGRKNVVNLAKGNSSIKEVSLQLDSYFLSDRDEKTIVDKIIVCVGTNDIRNCRENGVKHLKGPLIALIDQINSCFPEATVWFQSILPLPLQHQFSVRNVEQFNSLLLDICSFKRIYYLDVFSKLLMFDYRCNSYFRNEFFFINRKNIHLNKIGLSVLARIYIRVIHSNRFNPLGY